MTQSNNNNNNILGFIILGLIISLVLVITNGPNINTTPVNDEGTAIITEIAPRVQIPLNVFFAEQIGVPTTLIDDTIVNSYVINVTGGSWIVGDKLQIAGGVGRFYRGTVLGVSANTLTMDRALDFNFNASLSVVFEINTNLAVDGSTTARIFQVGPVGEDLETFISRIIPHCTDGVAGSDDKFCGNTALTRGLTFRYSNGFKFNIWNIKSNGDFIKMAYDITYSDKVGGGLFGVGSRLTYAGDDKHGTYLFLTENTTLEIWVQDDLTGINDLTYTAQGYFRFVNESLSVINN